MRERGKVEDEGGGGGETDDWEVGGRGGGDKTVVWEQIKVL